MADLGTTMFLWDIRVGRSDRTLGLEAVIIPIWNWYLTDDDDKCLKIKNINCSGVIAADR